MKRFTPKTILIATLTIAAVALSAVGAAVSKDKDNDEGGVTKLVSTCTSINHFVDLGQPGFTTGDTYTWIDDLSLPDGSRKVGQAIGRCTLIDPSAGSFGCTVTAVFPEGAITTDLILQRVVGVVSVGAITGGTGRYRGVIGELSVDLGPPCGPHKLTINLQGSTLKFKE